MARVPTYLIPPGVDAYLDRALQAQLAEHPEESGVRLLSDGVDAFVLRALSARLAERSLDLQYYIWHDDLTGRYLAYEALRAADRGVRVRILLDDMDARPRDSVLTALARHPKIEVRLFNPFAARSGMLRMIAEVFTRGSHLNHRMHNKSWIADGRIAFVGGRNVGDEYYSASKEVNFVDLDVLLAGEAVNQAALAFDRYWNNEVSIPVNRLRRTSRPKMTLGQLRDNLERAARAAASSEYAHALRESHRLESLLRNQGLLRWSRTVRVIADDPRKARPDKGPMDPGVLASFVAAVGETQRELLLISPYFVPGAHGTGALCELVRKGAEVGVLTNSLAATDVAAVHSGYSRYRKTLLEGGVKLYELKPTVMEEGSDRRMRLGSSRASLHTKAAVVDGLRSFVGSFNIDPRSAALNCEMGVWMDEAAVAEELRKMFAAAAVPERSFIVTLDARGATHWMELRDGATLHHDRDPDASWGRRAITWLLQFLPLESQL
jgi:putative cardiolipin synthase